MEAYGAGVTLSDGSPVGAGVDDGDDLVGLGEADGCPLGVGRGRFVRRGSGRLSTVGGVHRGRVGFGAAGVVTAAARPR